MGEVFLLLMMTAAFGAWYFAPSGEEVESDSDGYVGTSADATPSPEPATNPSGWPFSNPQLAKNRLVAGGSFDDSTHESALFDTVRAFESDLRAAGYDFRYVLSAYRNEAFNRKIGGVRGSRHTKGTAIDFAPTGSRDRARMRSLAKAMADKGWLVIIYDTEWANKPETFIHINKGQAPGVLWNVSGKLKQDGDVEL